MQSITKPSVDRATVDALVTAAFGPGALPVRSRPITDGTYNTIVRVALADGRTAMLKVAPAPDAPQLSYERDILRTEALFFDRAAGLDGVPTPRLLSTGFERSLVPGDFVFMTEVPGRSLSALHASLAPEELAAVRRDLGGVVARLHTVRGDTFGYPQAASAGSWAEAFGGMAEVILADAERLGADLTRPAAEIRAAVTGALGLLEGVTVPVLVHFDLWDGNVLVEGSRVSGVIDGERAFWGDPYADFASLALFGDIEDDAAFLEGYRAAGGSVAFTAGNRRRIALYRVYLYLIMLTEGSVRGYTEEQSAKLRDFLGPLLAGDLAALKG
ncbi:hypothetical protein SRB5_02640 [Streptomyces sp. RB5]|uniref:Aminoglycoside phosphotransferase domain-containing protein n=1 Tax=Streptomyces smaragdinus TaxID=2585196 RepID=A0A7K0C9M6_9ACTN|nr:aminoglycoside phosphotransferase family protein [Streptomyces smaragdinus]MQY10157.1 hypothetical protein [Streptomyces smaragdinus]